MTDAPTIGQKILGIDPGSRITGYGVIDQQGNRLSHVDNGAIITRSDQPLPQRLKVIHDGLGEDDVVGGKRPFSLGI